MSLRTSELTRPLQRIVAFSQRAFPSLWATAENLL